MRFRAASCPLCLWHLRATGRGDEVIPLFAGQLEVRRGGKLLDLLGLGGADNGDDLGRVLKDPGQGDELTADAAILSDAVEDGQNGGRIIVTLPRQKIHAARTE